MEENFESWNESTSLPDLEAELKKIRKSLRKRNFLIVLTSLVLAAVICFAAVRFAVPALEKRYWDPNTQTYCEFTNDLSLALAAYSELFAPSQIVDHAYGTRTGFATYSLSIQQWGYATRNDRQSATGTLEKGNMTLPDSFWNYCAINTFERACYPAYYNDEEFHRNAREDLERLPDYIIVEAAVSFPEDKSMEEIAQLQESLEEGFLEWVAVRTCGMEEQMYPLMGMKPYVGGLILEEMNEHYPYFDIKLNEDPEYFDDHFKALLQFSLDQQSAGTSIDRVNYLGRNQYEEALSYVEENGVYSYGAYIIAPASELLQLLDSGEASQIWTQNAWIDF